MVQACNNCKRERQACNNCKREWCKCAIVAQAWTVRVRPGGASAKWVVKATNYTRLNIRIILKGRGGWDKKSARVDRRKRSTEKHKSISRKEILIFQSTTSFLDSSGSFVLISDFLLVCTAVSLQNNENILLFCIVPPRISGAAARDRGASWAPCAASPD